MISSDIIRGHNDIIVLYMLKQQDSYGYEISKQIEIQTDGDYTIKETTLYSTFTRLQKNGYISSYSGTVTNGRKRTYYKITCNGVKYYQEKCHEWILTKNVVNQFIEEVK